MHGARCYRVASLAALVAAARAFIAPPEHLSPVELAQTEDGGAKINWLENDGSMKCHMASTMEVKLRCCSEGMAQWAQTKPRFKAMQDAQLAASHEDALPKQKRLAESAKADYEKSITARVYKIGITRCMNSDRKNVFTPPLAKKEKGAREKAQAELSEAQKAHAAAVAKAKAATVISESTAMAYEQESTMCVDLRLIRCSTTGLGKVWRLGVQS